MESSSPRLNKLPLLFLWMNSGCNARCPMCEIWRDQSRTRWSANQLRSWLPDWRQLGVADVQLCGESTLHPELWEICKSLYESKINIHLLTNGLRLAQCAEQVASYAASVTVSLDGPPEIHDRVRNVPRAYERLADGVKRLRELAPDLLIEGRCAVHRHNFRHLRETVKVAHELAISSISFLGLDITSSAFGREGLAREEWASVAEMALQKDEIPLLAEELEHLVVEHAQDFASGFIVETPDILRGVLVDYYASLAGQGRYRPRTTRCNAPWTSAVLEPDGAVRPCFFLPSYGNLNESETFEDVLNGPSARQYRAGLDIATNPICKHCICPRYVEIDGVAE